MSSVSIHTLSTPSSLKCSCIFHVFCPIIKCHKRSHSPFTIYWPHDKYFTVSFPQGSLKHPLRRCYRLCALGRSFLTFLVLIFLVYKTDTMTITAETRNLVCISPNLLLLTKWLDSLHTYHLQVTQPSNRPAAISSLMIGFPIPGTRPLQGNQSALRERLCRGLSCRTE